MKNKDQKHLISEYSPYEAFWEGFIDYRHGLRCNPYHVPSQGAEAHAWEHGQEASMRLTRATARV